MISPGPFYSLNGLDKQISQLIMGTMYFTPENYQDFVCPILDAFVEAGGRIKAIGGSNWWAMLMLLLLCGRLKKCLDNLQGNSEKTHESYQIRFYNKTTGQHFFRI